MAVMRADVYPGLQTPSEMLAYLEANSGGLWRKNNHEDGSRTEVFY